MGMGEPLLNYDNVIDCFLKLNKKYPTMRSALSTSVPIPAIIEKLAKDVYSLNDFKLTISLTSFAGKQQDNWYLSHNSLESAKYVADIYRSNTHHELDWSYLLLGGVNDTVSNAYNLLDFLNDGDRIKLIVFNSVQNERSIPLNPHAELFKQILEQKKIEVIILRSMGTEINAGLGQLCTATLN